MTTPLLVTETNEKPPWTDCTICAGLMAVNKITGNKYPATLIEREALRHATGDFWAGVRLEDLNVGIKRRYGFELEIPMDYDWPRLRNYLTTEGGAVIQGLYARLGEPYVRWDRLFAAHGSDSGHAMFADRYNPLTDKVFVLDPLGRGNDPRTGEPYAGEWMDATNVRAFLSGFRHWAGGFFVALAPDAEQVPHPTPKPTPEPAGDTKVKFIQISAADAAKLPSINIPAHTPIETFDGEQWAKIGPTKARAVPGLVDGHTNRQAVVVTTGRFYKDGQQRLTIQVAVLP